jgi:hypothetical protein
VRNVTAELANVVLVRTLDTKGPERAIAGDRPPTAGVAVVVDGGDAIAAAAGARFMDPWMARDGEMAGASR